MDLTTKQQVRQDLEKIKQDELKEGKKKRRVQDPSDQSRRFASSPTTPPPSSIPSSLPILSQGKGKEKVIGV